MRDRNTDENEAAVLRRAADCCEQLPRAGAAVARKSLDSLGDERVLFDQAMTFNLAAIAWAVRGAPIADDGLRAAIALGCYAHDMLLCGWDALLRGFYSVAVHSVRNIDQAGVTALAATIDPEISRAFWEDRLSDGNASKALELAIRQEDPQFGAEWGQRRLDIRKLYHKYMHPGRAAVSPSIVIGDDSQFAVPTVGGAFVEQRCQMIGRLYADLAFKTAVDVALALKDVLPADGELRREFEDLASRGKPLIESWEKAMGFA